MAYVDEVIKDFLTGRLDAKIRMREMWVVRKKPSENIGGGKTFNRTAPQEIQLMKLEEDEELAALNWNKTLIEDWWDHGETPETRSVIKLKACKELTWPGVAMQAMMCERKAQELYYTFRDTIAPHLIEV